MSQHGRGLEGQILNVVDPGWLELVARHPQANIFHHPAWLTVLSDCYGFHPSIIVLSNSDDGLHAGLPIMEIQNPLMGRRWVSLPFTDHCTPLAKSEEGRAMLIHVLSEYSLAKGSKQLELRWEWPNLPRLERDTRYVITKLKIQSDKEKALSTIHPMHRRNIKIAQKRGVQVMLGKGPEEIELFYNLHVFTRHRQGLPVQPRRFFKLIHRLLLSQGLGFVSLAYMGRHCVAGAVFLHWNKTLTYKYGASVEEGYHNRANALIFWSAICWGIDHDCEFLDMGRSDLDNIGLREFKQRWGAEEKPLTYSYLSKVRAPSGNEKLPLILKAILRRSPLWVPRITGELFYKYFG